MSPFNIVQHGAQKTRNIQSVVGGGQNRAKRRVIIVLVHQAVKLTAQIAPSDGCQMIN